MSFTGLCVEWLKSRARSERWAEEVECLGEEMRRVLAYFEWKAEWWLQRGGWRANEGEDMQEALNAYAAKEAQVLWDMGDSFADQWYPLLVSQGIDPKWPSRYLASRSSSGNQMDVVEMEVDDDENDCELDDTFD